MYTIYWQHSYNMSCLIFVEFYSRRWWDRDADLADRQEQLVSTVMNAEWRSCGLDFSTTIQRIQPPIGWLVSIAAETGCRLVHSEPISQCVATVSVSSSSTRYLRQHTSAIPVIHATCNMSIHSRQVWDGPACEKPGLAVSGPRCRTAQHSAAQRGTCRVAASRRGLVAWEMAQPELWASPPCQWPGGRDTRATPVQGWFFSVGIKYTSSIK